MEEHIIFYPSDKRVVLFCFSASIDIICQFFTYSDSGVLHEAGPEDKAEYLLRRKSSAGGVLRTTRFHKGIYVIISPFKT